MWVRSLPSQLPGWTCLYREPKFAPQLDAKIRHQYWAKAARGEPLDTEFGLLLETEERLEAAGGSKRNCRVLACVAVSESVCLSSLVVFKSDRFGFTTYKQSS
ncbi:hypothetical protein Bbelb_364930 [Branchiostoma belcheri]|nr:hypothetical protein Bbelb_364930 [Branchiostoma belcheri]